MANHAIAVLLLLLVSTCLCTGLSAVRSQREVLKRTRLQEDGPTDLPTDTNKEQPRRYLSTRLTFSPSVASGREPNPVLDMRDSAAGGKLVAVKMFENDQDWIVAHSVNGSLQRRVHRRPLQGWTLMLFAVSPFHAPFLYWLCCMVISICRLQWQ
ncbi:hypothetical protein MRX96_006706 [Rhipicephalus microplus]|uniref:Secreted protein n=1 Tax=Rhipicephalus microplus TaxID=6941 RepID=A0A9J6DBQ3_RHIMP|nr:hypothetical protein HPB51_020303 [Rhipicephalus microplus]